MQINRRTSALLSVGVISFAAVVQAEEKASPLAAALASTTISGYVDTSAQWNLGTGNTYLPPYTFGGTSKADGFNLNVVQLSIAKPLEEGEWSAGYQVDLWFGPDANTLATQSSGSASDLAIRQAYVALRTPVGNGIDWKVGVFDTVLGYEVLGSPNNNNFTRSYGFTIEPTTHTGIQAGYKVSDALTLTAGVVDTFGPMINERANPPKAESYKAYIGSIALTAPDSWGWAKGSSLTAAVVNGFNSALGDNQTSWYLGSTLNTPVTGLKVGACFDYADFHNQSAEIRNNQWVIGGYASYQATEKLSFHGRGEYFVTDASYGTDSKLWELTATIQYDLWKNVLSRLEYRWDHSGSGDAFGGTYNSGGGGGGSLAYDSMPVPNLKNANMILASITYKF
jgi:hypothetical protein